MLGMGYLMYVTLKHYGVIPLMLGMGHLMYVTPKHYGVLPLMLAMGHLRITSKVKLILMIQILWSYKLTL